MIDRAEVQVPQHVTRGEAGDQKLFRVVARCVAAETRVAGTFDRRLTGRRDGVVTTVALIRLRAGAIVAGPVHADFVGVLFHSFYLEMISRIQAADTMRPFAISSTTKIN